MQCGININSRTFTVCIVGAALDLGNVPDQWLILAKVVFGPRRVTPLGATIQPAVVFGPRRVTPLGAILQPAVVFGPR